MREEVYEFFKEYGFTRDEIHYFQDENEKMFFTNLIEVNKNIDFLKNKGLNKENGVLIPYQNVKNLTLSDEVIEAVKEGTFHIYPISTIDEGIEILTGVKAGEMDENGNYEEGTINYLVSEKLKSYAEKSKHYN